MNIDRKDFNRILSKSCYWSILNSQGIFNLNNFSKYEIYGTYVDYVFKKYCIQFFIRDYRYRECDTVQFHVRLQFHKTASKPLKTIARYSNSDQRTLP